ncbi:hypothetical protein Bca52824_076249 [Brassica carinata]|uniref:RNase H type-1 domain-containing protein n=2 Tax=Brassica TaxID=3705 RepID=A0A8X7PSR8_BRACI|nr:hypothetical protein Bca52824_076249 [Brassica carinata]VDD56109.1 unnamed protein product [Brassica oleracea]
MIQYSASQTQLGGRRTTQQDSDVSSWTSKDTPSTKACIRKGMSHPPLTAEALALRWTISTANSNGFSNVCFNTDCQSLLAAINSKDPPADLYGIVQDIEQLSSLLCSVSFKFIARLLNSTADRLAKSSLCNAIVTLP